MKEEKKKESECEREMTLKLSVSRTLWDCEVAQLWLVLVLFNCLFIDAASLKTEIGLQRYSILQQLKVWKPRERFLERKQGLQFWAWIVLCLTSK